MFRALRSITAGRTLALQMSHAIANMSPLRNGGADVPPGSPRSAIRSGIVFCPEDRKKEGIIPVRSVAENINISARRSHLRGGFFLKGEWEKHNASSQIARLGVRTHSPNAEIRFLSGGNQQKAILARWLSEDTKVVVLDEPTRGIDVGAKSEIYALIHEMAAAGAAIVIVSSELPEVLGIADRIIVMREGVVSAQFGRDEATPDDILHAALPLEVSAN